MLLVMILISTVTKSFIATACRDVHAYPCFPLFPSVDENQNIPTLFTWRFQDNNRSPTRPFQLPCWTRQQHVHVHVSKAGLREDPGKEFEATFLCDVVS